jgi:hypothetical protein
MWKLVLNGKCEKRGQLYTGKNDNQQILGRTGESLGYYLASADKTYDKQGRYVGPGDQRMSLLED